MSDENTEVDYSQMSDEEIMNIDISTFEDDAGDDDETSEKSEEAQTEEGATDSDSSEEDSEDESPESEKETESTSAQLDGDDTDADEQEEETPTDDAEAEDTEDTDDTQEVDGDDGDKESDDTDDSKVTDADKIAGYDALMGKIKANGTEIQVDSVEDAVRLMQMGAGFHKKMEQIKPVRKIGQTLQNHGLLDEKKINFLIDVSKGDPEAIKQLLRDTKINPLDLNMESDTKYTSNTYTATNQEIDLNDTLGDIQDTPSGKETIDIISNKWDAASRDIIYKNPQVLHAINQHVASGIYKQINDKVNSERALGRLQGVSSIDAYKIVGDLMFPQTPQREEKGEKQEVKPSPKANTDKLTSRKKTAKTPKSKQAAPSPKEVDISSMSDDEFEKYLNSVNY